MGTSIINRKIFVIGFFCLAVGSLASIVLTKQRLGIDFAGGTIIEFKLSNLAAKEMIANQLATAKIYPVSISSLSDNRFSLCIQEHTGNKGRENIKDPKFLAGLKTKISTIFEDIQFEPASSEMKGNNKCTIIQFRLPTLNTNQPTVNIATVRDTLKPLLSHTSFALQDLSDNRFAIRVRQEGKDQGQDIGDEAFVADLKSRINNAFNNLFTVQFEQIESIGPQVSSDLIKQACTGLLCACIAILFYMSMRFHWKFALSGVIVLFMDVLITYGFMRMLEVEINLTLVAAFLTIIGYCINDTVVIYDRIRLNFQKYSSLSVQHVISRSVTETLRRSITTSLVTLLAVVSIMFFSDHAIRNFAVATSFGIVIGTIGSVCIAPLLLNVMKIERPKEKPSVVDPMFYAS